MAETTRALLDFGDRVAGQVLDAGEWMRDRVRPAVPARHVIGEVSCLFPHAPEIVEVRLGSGVTVLVAVGGVRCDEGCPHPPHPPGDCLAGTLTDDGDAAYCVCGEAS